MLPNWKKEITLRKFNSPAMILWIHIFRVEVILTVREQSTHCWACKLYAQWRWNHYFWSESFRSRRRQPTYEVIDTTSNGVFQENPPFSHTLHKLHGNDRLTFRFPMVASKASSQRFFRGPSGEWCSWSGPVEINGTEDEFFVVDFSMVTWRDHVDILITQYPENGFLWEEFVSGYFPDNHYNGSDSFKYVVWRRNREWRSNVRINLTPPMMLLLPAIPLKPIKICGYRWVEWSDVDGDTLTYSIVTQPKHGFGEENVNQWTTSYLSNTREPILLGIEHPI